MSRSLPSAAMLPAPYARRPNANSVSTAHTCGTSHQVIWARLWSRCGGKGLGHRVTGGLRGKVDISHVMLEVSTIATACDYAHA